MDRYDPDTIADVFPGGFWQAATFCGPNGGNCVEVNLGAEGLIGLRDSKPAASPLLAFDTEEWSAFLNAAKSGRFGRV
jgi:hypothetical protein